MIEVSLLIVDTSKYDEEYLLGLNDSFSDVKNNETRIHKIVSSYLKKKYIGEYHLTKFSKPIRDDKYFNISHSGKFVLLALADYPIGIDVEQIKDYKDEVAKFVCSETEYKKIKDNESFFRIWTSKEALAKADGRGLTIVKEIPALPLVGLKKYQDKIYSCEQLKLDDYIVSIAVESNDSIKIDKKEITL